MDNRIAGAEPDEDDSVLLAKLRAGEEGAYDLLYRRHAPAVRRYALSVRRPGIDVDDVVAEVFLRVLRAVRTGHGPKDYVRTYLVTAVRRVLGEWVAARRDEPMHTDQLGDWAGRLPDDERSDHQTREAERELLAMAFSRLPARWRAVLWRMEVEGHRPASIAGEFGLTPNATAVLAHRARQGLRTAYREAAAGEHGGRRRRGPVAPGCAPHPGGPANGSGSVGNTRDG
ncbi:RNA polymerase sigma factor [Haloactinomyces albus]|uniref:RNA polymerase sigma factor (Sigma-70 family) n=1 Tax=Haloactinomyces albus TaxID=1352928 RepID=A0AAE3ZE07_9ACTN|nr:sigma-70 family RNA polymerase sigma factor [Haloactinomyces albus]MDR7301928.1 RNA polymerase sigma factor (sigma-70 family) [Haloactinomyces albus]